MLPDAPVYLLHVQLELECKRISAEGRLYPVPCDEPDDIPLLLVARHAQGWTRYYRHDLGAVLAARLDGFTPEQLWREGAEVRRLLARSGGTGVEEWRGSTYHFAKAPEPSGTLELIEEDGAFVVMRDGIPVSRAWSSRENESAAELALETLPSYRRNGFATLVASTWARHQLLHGRIAFYSHLQHNLASRALAERLGVKHLFDVVTYS